MIFNPFKASKCSVCRRSYETNDEVDRSDETLTKRALMEGKFKCANCGSEFHGKCGRIGQVSSTKASVTCPKCRVLHKLPLPFKFVKSKEKSGTSDAFIEQLRDDDEYAEE